MERFKSITILFLLLAVGLLASAAQAKPASVLLQEGLYAEQIEGDLDAAIKIYEKVIADAADLEQAAAHAMYRIGICYVKKGDKAKAAWSFGKLISEHAQQKALVAKAQEQLTKLRPQTKSEGEFGPVDERTVNDDGVGKNFMLDLDTGKLYSASDAKKWSEESGAGQEKSLEDFVMKSGVDLFGETSKKSLIGIDMIAMPTHNERWDMSPGDVIEQVSMGKPGTPIALSADGQLPKTFVFKTGQGGMGILQITEMQTGKAPRYFKIRYKMLQKESAGRKVWTIKPDLSSPEATIKSFVKAVYDRNLEAARACVSKDGHDYDEFKEMLATESNHPFQAMIKAMDVSVPVEVTTKDVMDDKCKLSWYLTLGRVYYFGETKMKKGMHQEFSSYLELVGDKWLIRDI